MLNFIVIINSKIKMKKSSYNKVLAFLFVVSLMLPLSVSFQSCTKNGPKYHNKVKYNKPKNGGKKTHASGDMGRQRFKKKYRRKKLR